MTNTNALIRLDEIDVEIIQLASEATEIRQGLTIPTIGGQITPYTIVDLVGKLTINEGSVWYPYKERDLNLLTHHVIHHTAVNGDSTPEAVARFHSINNGWPGIGYTFYIGQDGTIYRVNRSTTKSFATADMNHRYISTCLAGSFIHGRKPTLDQLNAARWVHNVAIPSDVGKVLPLLGHKQGDQQQTTCPGTSFNEWRGIIEAPY